MKYMYYMGASSGYKKNKPEEKWFSINVLRTNRWGTFEIKPLYVSDEKSFNDLCASAPPIGSAVDVKRNLDDEVTEIILLDDVPALELF